MADTQDPGGAAPQTPQSPPTPQQMPQVKILAHFVRDLSFENVGVIQGTPIQGQPDIAVQVHLDGSGIGEGNYQLNMKITAKAISGERTRFLVELDYGGVFSIENAAETHIHPLLFIECPRLLWPFARRVVADVTRDGGYPALMLDTIDFATLYRQKIEEMQRQSQAERAAGAGQGPSQPGGDGAGAGAGAGPSDGAAGAGRGTPDAAGPKPN
ncbi:MAG TPA: protein-export chaperone SecB [Thermohalobaculum sp.]|nr:protein-export chaperone SecB [Thermohalobaculum sp.]